MIFDTDVLIWFFRGNRKAAQAIDAAPNRCLSVVSYMELQQGARDKREAIAIKTFLKDFGFTTVAMSQNIGHRASIYVEEYSLAHGIGVADALIAATVVEESDVLLSGNAKHFKCIKELQLKAFRP